MLCLYVFCLITHSLIEGKKCFEKNQSYETFIFVKHVSVIFKVYFPCLKSKKKTDVKFKKLQNCLKVIYTTLFHLTL